MGRKNIGAVCIIGVLAASLIGAQAPSTPADVTEWMEGEKRASGSLPGPLEVAARLGAFRDSLSATQVREVWAWWAKAQDAPVSADDLADIVRAKRQAVDTARFCYTVKQEAGGAVGSAGEPYYETVSFLMKHGKLKTESRWGENEDALGRLVIQAYDGATVRRFKGPGKGIPPTGIVERKGHYHRHSYFDLENPLGQQMLYDSEADIGMRFPIHDLAMFVQPPGYVLERSETVRGRKAILCARGVPPQLVVWLDPDRNFAVLQAQGYKIRRDEEGVPLALLLDVTYEYTGFQDCGNGIWLPTRAVIQSYASDELIPGRSPLEWRRTVEVEEMHVNGEVDDAEFVDIFPVGTLVHDYKAGVSYHVGTIAEAEGILLETVDGLRTAIEPTDGRALAPPETSSVSSSAQATAWDRQELAVPGSSKEEGVKRHWIALIGIIGTGGAAIVFLRVFRRRRAASG